MPHGRASGLGSLSLALSLAVLTSGTAAQAGNGPHASQPDAFIRAGTISAAGTRKAQIPVRITWPRSTHPKGIRRYTLAILMDGRWKKYSASRNRKSMWLYPNAAVPFRTGNYQLRVRAIAGNGKIGPWSPKTELKVRQYQESHVETKFNGTWSTLKSSSAWEGRVRQSRAAGNTMRIKLLNARRVAIVATKAPGHGRFRVCVNRPDCDSGTDIVKLDGARKHRVLVWINPKKIDPGDGNTIRLKTLDRKKVQIDGVATVVTWK